MARKAIYLPDDLEKALAALGPINYSAVCQEALSALLDCDHFMLSCSDCGLPLDRIEILDDALSGYYGDLMWELRVAVDEGATAEGAARIAKRVATDHGVTAVERHPLPRPTRARRQTNDDQEAA